MSDLKLFKTTNGVKQLSSTQVSLEKELQNLIEKNMEVFFGVRFLKSEYTITKIGGRMDSIGIDENNCPVIFEYKRSSSDNVINQGLFYLDWLLDHQADFRLLVNEKLGKDAPEEIDWAAPCVICVANEFTKYDIYAVNQMQRNIKLVKYRKFDDDLILFEFLNTPSIKPSSTELASLPDNDDNYSKKNYKTHLDKLKIIPEKIKILYTNTCNYIESLGDDIAVNQLKYYIAYKKIQNLICIEVYNDHLNIFVKLNPDDIKLEEGFIEDVREIGHYGTGDVRIIIKNDNQLEKVKYLLEKAYNEA